MNTNKQKLMKAKEANSMAKKVISTFPEGDLDYILGCIEANAGSGELKMSLQVIRSQDFVKKKLLSLGYKVAIAKNDIMHISWA